MDPGFRNQVHGEISPHLLLGAQDQRLAAEQDQIPLESTGASSGNCQETKARMVRACTSHATTASPEPSSGHLEGWATPRSAEEMLNDKVKEWTSLCMPELLTTDFCNKQTKRLKDDLC